MCLWLTEYGFVFSDFNRRPQTWIWGDYIVSHCGWGRGVPGTAPGSNARAVWVLNIRGITLAHEGLAFVDTS